MRTRLAVAAALLCIALSGGAVVGDTAMVPHLVLEGGLVSSALPAFDVGVALGVAYESDDFVARSRTRLTVVPGFSVFHEASVRFWPGELEIGLEARLGIVPFFADRFDVSASVPLVEDDLGEGTPLLVTADVGGELWLGAIFGGSVFLNLAAEIPGESADLRLTSKTSLGYDALGGVGVEEHLGARVSLKAPRFFGGQLLTENDLSSLVAWTNVRLRLDARGLASPGILVGFDVRVASPLPAGE